MAGNAHYQSRSALLWWRPHRRRAARRQTVARWSAAVAYALLALGIPLPMPSGKAGKTPYPCMNHRCGCQSANQCWRNCCCMTLEERLIWARENHVRPPDFALAEARAQGIQWAAYWPDEPNQRSWDGNTDGEQNEQRLARTDCDRDGRCSCCQPVVSGCSCCARKSCELKTPPVEEPRPTGTVWLEALKCHGVSENWQGMPISLPPPTIVRFHCPDELVGQVSLWSPQFSSVSYPPAVPPPRLLTRG